MFDFLNNTGNFMFLMIFGIPMVAIIAHYWYLTLKNKSDNDLKQSMLQKGMSADDIEKIINAGRGKDEEE